MAAGFGFLVHNHMLRHGLPLQSLPITARIPELSSTTLATAALHRRCAIPPDKQSPNAVRRLRRVISFLATSPSGGRISSCRGVTLADCT